MPDLNSLPPSSPSPTQPPPASHTPPHSLAAAAAMNAGFQNEESRRLSVGSMRRDVERTRRRSSIRMNLNLNDPTLPAPGELQQSPSARHPWPRSPHHERTPSLGELHQELEYEQEGQVNRLLTMIRRQQAEIIALQASTQPVSAVDDSTPTSERSLSLPQSSQPTIPQTPASTTHPRSRSPLGPSYGNLSRHSSVADRSRGSSHTGSPALRPMSRGLSGSLPYEGGEWLPGSAIATSRDESTFYQAETQMLTRENQMLKLRIRELERQLVERDPTSGVTHSPAIASNLATNPPTSQQDTQNVGD